jgi:hypothetical protein
MTIEQQIEELRAELSAAMDRTEIAQIEADLQAALAELARLEAAFLVSAQ